eukprot:1691513-Lingulodinium_polyedra.AAC.1
MPNDAEVEDILGYTADNLLVSQQQGTTTSANGMCRSSVYRMEESQQDEQSRGGRRALFQCRIPLPTA